MYSLSKRWQSLTAKVSSEAGGGDTAGREQPLCYGEIQQAGVGGGADQVCSPLGHREVGRWGDGTPRQGLSRCGSWGWTAAGLRVCRRCRVAGRPQKRGGNLGPLASGWHSRTLSATPDGEWENWGEVRASTAGPQLRESTPSPLCGLCECLGAAGSQPAGGAAGRSGVLARAGREPSCGSGWVSALGSLAPGRHCSFGKESPHLHRVA